MRRLKLVAFIAVVALIGGGVAWASHNADVDDVQATWEIDSVKSLGTRTCVNNEGDTYRERLDYYEGESMSSDPRLDSTTAGYRLRIFSATLVNTNGDGAPDPASKAGDGATVAKVAIRDPGPDGKFDTRDDKVKLWGGYSAVHERHPGDNVLQPSEDFIEGLLVAKVAADPGNPNQYRSGVLLSNFWAETTPDGQIDPAGTPDAELGFQSGDREGNDGFNPAVIVEGSCSHFESWDDDND